MKEYTHIIITIIIWVNYRLFIVSHRDRIVELYQMYRPKWLTSCTTCFMYNLGAIEVVLMMVVWRLINAL